MKYDLIIVAATKDDSLRRMTQDAIDSCVNDGAEVNVILVETFRKSVAELAGYSKVNKFVIYNEEFNYNRCLNRGLAFRTGDVQIMANNDIIFEAGWSKIGQIMIDNGYLSASALSGHVLQRVFPREDVAYEGYDISRYVSGWCLFAQAKVFELIGRLDESFSFWYSDNTYVTQLKKAGIKNYLICNCVVNHYISRTLSKQDRKTILKYTDAERKNIHKLNR
jgi:hypothetical protein